jgi:hypothetical protein
MRYILIFLVFLSSLYAQSFSKELLLGEWEISVARLHRTISFLRYIGDSRDEVLKLYFNQRGKLKVMPINQVYNYEVVDGKLKIYEIKKTASGYIYYAKNQYDLFEIVGNYESCLKVKLIKKKIPGLKKRYDYKMCKISNISKPVYYENRSKFDF